MMRRLNNYNLRGYASNRVVQIALVGVIILVALAIFRSTAKTSTQQVKVEGARATEKIDQDFQFPIKNSDGDEIGRVTFSLTSAEIRDQLIIKGKKVTSVSGRTFLVLNIKVANDLERKIQVNSRDYFRLSANGNEEEKLAADVHNDPLEVQAISTKPTRLAFPVNESDKNFVLHVGEIKGEKQKVELKLSI